MSFSIKINNQYLPCGVKIKANSLQITYPQSGQRAVLSFSLVDENKTGVPFVWSTYIGKKVELYENGVLKYGGQLDEPSTRKINNHPILGQILQCVDWHFIADKTYINQSYPRQLISDTVKEMIDDFLADDGIWYDSNSIQTTSGQYISINCPYVFSSDAFNEMADLINWQWRIGPDKKFYFQEYTASLGGNLIENQSNYIPSSLLITKDRSEYRNKQILKDVNALTDILTEKATPTPDNDRSFVVRFALNQVPEIYISSNTTNPSKDDMVDPREIGIGGLETGLDWYWNKGSNIIQQDLEAEEIPSGKFLVVKYVGQYTIDIVETDDAAIIERQSIEGGSGVYSYIESGSEIEGIDIAETKAQAMLEKYSRIARRLEFSSYTMDFDVGQIIDVQIPSLNIDTITGDPTNDEYFLIIEKRVSTYGKLMLKSYTLIDGAPVGGWIRFFANLIKPGKDYEIRPNAKVDIPINTEEDWNWGGVVTITTYTPLYPLDDPGGLHPSNLLFPGTLTSTAVEND